MRRSIVSLFNSKCKLSLVCFHFILFCVAFLISPNETIAFQTNQTSSTSVSDSRASEIASTVGIEGTYFLKSTRSDWQPILVQGAPLVVRISNCSRSDNGQYLLEIKFIGLLPGLFDLRDFLRTGTGESSNSHAIQSEPALVTIRSVLPDEHDGVLADIESVKLPWAWPQKIMLLTLGVGWLAIPVGLLYRSWKQKGKFAPAEPLTCDPTLVQRMEPLIVAAINGTASPQDQAELERLIVAHWRKQLLLESSDLDESKGRIKSDPVAGELLQKLERWLYQPPGKNEIDIERLLLPYRKVER